jgi:hypothetical protein
MLIIGFGNRARHGKDTAGEAVVEYYQKQNARLAGLYGRHKPLNVKLYKFADALYRECREQHGMTEKDPALLQNVGMKRRGEDADYWVKQIDAQLEIEKPDMAVITDVRFLNEVRYVRQRRGVSVNVSRLNEDGSRYISTDRDPYHPSETELDGYTWNYFIKAYTGEVALVEQQAIFIAEFERARR